jgi:uncharacterized protein
MSDSLIGLCEVEFYLPGTTSLKSKRSIISPILHRARHTFNVSSAEVAHQDKWQSAKLAFVMVSSSAPLLHKTMGDLLRWLEESFPDAIITRHSTEVL